MCDYSLARVPNRLAAEGERLCVYQFDSGAKGLIAAADAPAREPGNWWERFKLWLGAEEDTPACVICVPPGARLQLHDIPLKLQQQLGVRESESVTFVQLHAEAYQYRDAIRFDNGRELLLQRLKEGQRLEVLSLVLPGEKTPAERAAPVAEPAYI